MHHNWKQEKRIRGREKVQQGASEWEKIRVSVSGNYRCPAAVTALSCGCFYFNISEMMLMTEFGGSLNQIPSPQGIQTENTRS